MRRLQVYHSTVARMSDDFAFNHIAPNGAREPYTLAQSGAIARAILQAPRGGKLKLPGLEDRFEVRWGKKARSWKTALCSPAVTCIYQVNISWGPGRANTRDVEIVESLPNSQ